MSTSSIAAFPIPNSNGNNRPWRLRLATLFSAYWRSMTRPMSSDERAEASVW